MYSPAQCWRSARHPADRELQVHSCVAAGEIPDLAELVAVEGPVRCPAGASDRFPPVGEPEDARLGVAEDSADSPSGPKPGEPIGVVEVSVFSHGHIMSGFLPEENTLSSPSINGFLIR